jgi:hypothetical protein
LPVSPTPPTAVEITGHARHADIEGVIERTCRQRARVEVTLLLSDGSAAEADLHVHDWDWLDLRLGDIVAVRPIIPSSLDA